jgi:hypothetical protein
MKVRSAICPKSACLCAAGRASCLAVLQNQFANGGVVHSLSCQVHHTLCTLEVPAQHFQATSVMLCTKRCLGVQGPGTVHVLWTGYQAFLLCQLRCQCICCSHTDACTCCMGGQAIDVLVRGDTPVTLTEYIVIFGAINLVIAQCPNVHSIRFVNQCSTFCTICFSIIAVALSLYSGAHSCHPFLNNIIIIITRLSNPFEYVRRSSAYLADFQPGLSRFLLHVHPCLQSLASVS